MRSILHVDMNNYYASVECLYRPEICNFPVAVVGDLLYVGRSTAKKLELIAVNTIGDLARMDVEILKRRLGKWGEILWLFANGMDTSPVRKISESEQIKSIGNSTTCSRDLQTEQDVRLVFTVLDMRRAASLKAGGVGMRYTCHLRKDGSTVQRRRQVVYG